jgi:hypothetical protein
MSAPAMQWVFEDSAMYGTARLVLLAVANDAGPDGFGAYPSIQRLAKHAKVQRNTAIAGVRTCEEAGELLVLRPESYGRGRFNRYTLVMGRTADEMARLIIAHGESTDRWINLLSTLYLGDNKGSEIEPLPPGKARLHAVSGSMDDPFRLSQSEPDPVLTQIDPVEQSFTVGDEGVGMTIPTEAKTAAAAGLAALRRIQRRTG